MKDVKMVLFLMNYVENFGLVNIFDRLYPDQHQFKTYQRGSKIIDFALASLHIADKITNFVYEPFLYRLKGDRWAFFFDINERILFGDIDPSPFDPTSRGFISHDVKMQKSIPKKGIKYYWITTYSVKCNVFFEV